MHLLAFAETIQLFPDGTLLIHVAMILVMIWILNRTLYRPINRVLESREKNKGGHSGEAVGLLKDAADKEARYKAELLESRSKGYEIVEEEQKVAVAEREAKLSEAKTEIAQMFEKGKAEIETQGAKVHAKIGAEAERLADSIATNILKG